MVCRELFAYFSRNTTDVYFEAVLMVRLTNVKMWYDSLLIKTRKKNSRNQPSSQGEGVVVKQGSVHGRKK